MGNVREQAYSDGFIDGQISIIEQILDIVDRYGGWLEFDPVMNKDAVSEIRDFVMDCKKEIDSL